MGARRPPHELHLQRELGHDRGVREDPLEEAAGKGALAHARPQSAAGCVQGGALRDQVVEARHGAAAEGARLARRRLHLRAPDDPRDGPRQARHHPRPVVPPHGGGPRRPADLGRPRLAQREERVQGQQPRVRQPPDLLCEPACLRRLQEGVHHLRSPGTHQRPPPGGGSAGFRGRPLGDPHAARHLLRVAQPGAHARGQLRRLQHLRDGRRAGEEDHPGPGPDDPLGQLGAQPREEARLQECADVPPWA
eukprot:9469566-Pyramimonas_sp.AAC.3